MAEPATVTTMAELARRLGVHDRTVRRWHAAGGMPVTKAGRYHVEKIRAWRSTLTSQNHERSGAAAQGLEVDVGGDHLPARGRRDELRDARVEDLRLKIRERELEHKARVAELVPRADVGKLLFERGMFFRRQLMALARNLAQLLAAESEPVRVQRALEDALLSVLEEAYSNVPAEYRT